MVSSEGKLKIANNTLNKELLWAVKGAGPIMGAITTLKYTLPKN
jgi:hypothetical protein